MTREDAVKIISEFKHASYLYETAWEYPDGLSKEYTTKVQKKYDDKYEQIISAMVNSEGEK